MALRCDPSQKQLLSENHKSRGRKRILMSCSECHRRKQKCDRQSPCYSCIKRGAQDLCRYNTGPKAGQATRSRSGESGPSEIGCDTNGILGPEWASGLRDQIRDFGYSSYGKHNSMSLFRTAEMYGGQDTNLIAPATTQPTLQNDCDRKYKELIRQLPSQTCIDILIQTFFSSVNWQYDLLDEESFRERLEIWRKISYSDLQVSFGRLPLETLVFPLVLFQVLAHALLFHPPHDEMINSLMTMPGMTFHDLGAEYSNTGAELLTLLEKRNIKIAMIQAGLLRASFLKSSGKVVEAWHALGTTIRDAQEIGLHTGRIVSEQSPIDPKHERQIISFAGHKIWVVLHVWDVHMAVVLGRPIATDLQIGRFSLTVEDDGLRRELFSHWQSETDPPRPFDIILAGYNVAYRYFKDIHQLEHSGATHQDYPTVERIHTAIINNIQLLPSWCRLENPDTKFDRLDGCQWLPVARQGLSSLINFVLLALHRPFIFSVANSRVEAVKAGISILRAQEQLFQQSDPHQRKVFNPVYASFDAIVLLAALCIVFPNEDHKRKTECVDVVERGIQILYIVGQSNSMAKLAHGIVCSLYHRLKHRLGISKDDSAGAMIDNSKWILPNINTDYSQPSGFPLDTVLPPRPTHDLFFEHISTPQFPLMDTTDGLPFESLHANATDNWNFEGTFADSSFWDIMNEFDH